MAESGYFLAREDISFPQPHHTLLEEFWLNSRPLQCFLFRKWTDENCELCVLTGRCNSARTSCFPIPQVTHPQDRQGLPLALMLSHVSLCEQVCACVRTLFPLREGGPCPRDTAWDPHNRQHRQRCSEWKEGAGRGRWPALARAAAGPRAACAHCGGAATPPRRSRPARAGGGSGSGGWCTGSPRVCGSPGWGSPSSGAARTASPGERRSLEVTWGAQNRGCWLQAAPPPWSHSPAHTAPTNLGRRRGSQHLYTQPVTTGRVTPINAWESSLVFIILAPFLSQTFSVNSQFLCKRCSSKISYPILRKKQFVLVYYNF